MRGLSHSWSPRIKRTRPVTTVTTTYLSAPPLTLPPFRTWKSQEADDRKAGHATMISTYARKCVCLEQETERLPQIGFALHCDDATCIENTHLLINLRSQNRAFWRRRNTHANNSLVSTCPRLQSRVQIYRQNPKCITTWFNWT